MNAQPALDDYLRDLLGADIAPAPAPVAAVPATPLQVVPIAPDTARAAADASPAPEPPVLALAVSSGESMTPAEAFDAAHEEVLERLLATTRGIAVADDPEAILALRQMEAAPLPAPAADPREIPITAVAAAAEPMPIPENGEIPMTPVEALPAKLTAPAGDLITDDEFESLLDHLHGGAAPGARAPEIAPEPVPPPPAVVAETPIKPVPPPEPTPFVPVAAPVSIPAYAKPVFDMLQRRRQDDDLPASSPHGERRRASDRSTRWLRMRCDEQHYALELLKVQEVVLPTTLLPLRGAAPHMLGVMNLRGQVVPVLDLGLYLGRAAITPDSHVRIVVLEENGEILGLRVSAVEDVTSLTEHQIEPPDNTRMCRITHPLFRGVARLSGRTVILLDASELLK
ncbi:chemotaxis protein CheW [Pseudoxanthomonas beigongshangi]